MKYLGSSKVLSDPDENTYQIVGVVSALLALRNWKLGSRLIAWIDELVGINAIKYQCVRHALIILVDWVLQEKSTATGFKSLGLSFKKDSKSDLFYGDLPNLGSDVQCIQVSTLSGILSDVFPMLRVLGHYLSASPSLFCRLCRVLKACLEESVRPVGAVGAEKMEVDGNNDNNGEVSDTVQSIADIVSTVLLPSFSKIQCNPSAASRLWELMSLLPYDVRYRVYDSWKGNALGKQAIDEKPLEVVFAEVKVLHGVKGPLKRLTKETTKLMGRQIAKYTHSCSLIVFEWILNQVEMFDNLIPYVIDALKYTTDLVDPQVADLHLFGSLGHSARIDRFAA